VGKSWCFYDAANYISPEPDGGCFVKLDDPAEIAKALAIKGISKCRDQDEEKYGKCWSCGPIANGASS
jgi:hypothetical protein